eukprot:4824031-Pyramimonas_sp.AAC.1
MAQSFRRRRRHFPPPSFSSSSDSEVAAGMPRRRVLRPHVRLATGTAREPAALQCRALPLDSAKPGSP